MSSARCAACFEAKSAARPVLAKGKRSPVRSRPYVRLRPPLSRYRSDCKAGAARRQECRKIAGLNDGMMFQFFAMPDKGFPP
jgi:hypothetical protein